MSFIVNKTSASYIDENSINIEKTLPFGIWSPTFDKFRGIFLEKSEYKTEHGKIYGKSQKIADHIYEAYNKTHENNLGVLLSGGKGLGKSLTARLVIEHAVKDEIPVIVVNEYLPDLFNFMKNIKNSVILFDEFEKVFSGKVNEESDDRTLSKQEEMLSLLDGTSIGNHNLFIMTVNDLSRINENLKSRPGRIKYHYRYDSEGEDTIRAYCADHLQRKDLENDIVNSLLANRYVSLDIIKALVDELNYFEDLTVDEAMDYLNIEIERISAYAKITYYVYGQKHTEDIYVGTYYTGQKNLGCEVSSSDKEDSEGKEYYFAVKIQMKGQKIPTIGSIDVSEYTSIHDYSDDIKAADLHVTKVELYEEGAFTKENKVCAYSELSGDEL